MTANHRHIVGDLETGRGQLRLNTSKFSLSQAATERGAWPVSSVNVAFVSARTDSLNNRSIPSKTFATRSLAPELIKTSRCSSGVR